MFKCDNCDRITNSSEKEGKIITKIRDKIYYEKDKFGSKKEIARGHEIVKEIKVCESCAKEYKNAA